MLLLVFSAAMVGFIHSLVPAHWVPIVLVSRARKWNLKQTLLGALAASSGHVFISSGIALLAVFLQKHYWADYEEAVEQYSGLILFIFGLVYAAFQYFQHARCHHHSHHHEEIQISKQKRSYSFLFMMGFSPCIAVLPVLIAVEPYGGGALFLALVLFASGVFSALSIAAWLGRKGMTQLDHPVLEHYGDVITGLGIALVGLFLWLL